MYTSKYIDKIGINKATGLGNLSAKLIKLQNQQLLAHSQTL